MNTEERIQALRNSKCYEQVKKLDAGLLQVSRLHQFSLALKGADSIHIAGKKEGAIYRDWDADLLEALISEMDLRTKSQIEDKLLGLEQLK